MLDAVSPSNSNDDEPEPRLEIGMTVTMRHGDEVWRRYFLTVPQCEDVMQQQVRPLKVITTWHPLGQLILGKGIGYEARYRDQGKERVAWIESIEDGPVLDGRGQSDPGQSRPRRRRPDDHPARPKKRHQDLVVEDDLESQ
jgi:hypothetical protein